MSNEEGDPLFSGNAVTIWAETFEEDGKKEMMVTIRIGMTTIQMPVSVFLELQAGSKETLEKINSMEKLE